MLCYEIVDSTDGKISPRDIEWASQYHPAGANSLNPMEMAQMEEQFRQSRSSDLSGKKVSHSAGDQILISIAPRS